MSTALFVQKRRLFLLSSSSSPPLCCPHHYSVLCLKGVHGILLPERHPLGPHLLCVDVRVCVHPCGPELSLHLPGIFMSLYNYYTCPIVQLLNGSTNDLFLLFLSVCIINHFQKKSPQNSIKMSSCRCYPCLYKAVFSLKQQQYETLALRKRQTGYN